MKTSLGLSLLAVLALASLSLAAQQGSNSNPPVGAPQANKGAQKPAGAPSAPAAAHSGSASLPSDATVDAFLKQMYGWNQDLKWKIEEIKPSEAPGISEAVVVFSAPQGQQMVRLYVTPDQKYAFTGELVPFGANPFAQTREELKNATGPVEGPKDAAVTIVEFGDLQCPACKAAQPNVTRLMQDEPRARLVFENLPLPQHDWAMLGAKYLDCLGRESTTALWKFIPLVYDHQSEVTAENAEQKLKDFVKEAGGDPAAAAACSAQAETEKRITESRTLGEKLNVTSTPTFFINGRKIVGFSNNVPYDAVKSMVDFDLMNPAK